MWQDTFRGVAISWSYRGDLPLPNDADGAVALMHEKDLGRYFVLRCKRLHRLMTLYDVFISA